MNVNPMELLKMKTALDGFNSRHPKFVCFLRDIAPEIDTGSVLEISVTSPEGKKTRTNIRITAEDKDLLASIGGLIGK